MGKFGRDGELSPGLREEGTTCQGAEWFAALSSADAMLPLREAVCRGLQREQDGVKCAYLQLWGIEIGNDIAEAVGVETLLCHLGLRCRDLYLV